MGIMMVIVMLDIVRDVRSGLCRLLEEAPVVLVGRTDFYVCLVEFCGHVVDSGTQWPAPGKMLAEKLEEVGRANLVRELQDFPR